MRIALITHKVDFHDGQGRVNYEIVKAALDAGHHVTVVAERCARSDCNPPECWFYPDFGEFATDAAAQELALCRKERAMGCASIAVNSTWCRRTALSPGSGPT